MSDGTVYVVDDDDAVRESLSLLLTVKGNNAVAFPSAESFLEAFEPGQRGCVIADVRMRGMSGFDLLSEMRRRALTLPVIIITGHGDVPMAVAALKAGAVDFIEKPYENSTLLDRVRQAMERHDRENEDLKRGQEVAARLQQLSRREREVLDLVMTGIPNKSIAGRLGISTRTVEIHRANMMEKMRAQGLSDLVRMVTIQEILVRKSAPSGGGGNSAP